MSAIKNLTTNFNIAQAQVTSQALMNHAQSVQEQITALQEINKQNTETSLPAIKIAYEKLLERKKTLELRLWELNGSYYQDPNSLLHKLSQDSSATGQQKLSKGIIERDALLKELKEIEKKLNYNEKIQSFLKVRKIEVKLHNLCGAYYKDPNGLLDQAWKAYKDGIGSKEYYDGLEACKNSLIAKKDRLQVLCSDLEFSNLQQLLPQMIISLQAELKEALDTAAFIQELGDWYVAEGCLVGAKKACGRIFVCYVQKDNLLDISVCSLKSLPKVIGQLTKLTTLYISMNSLEDLPLEICQLTQLTTLVIDGNQIRNLPSEISQLTQLTELFIGYNQLQALPPEIGQLMQLTALNINSNQFQSFPLEICQLTQLTTLLIDNNHFQNLPAEISQLTQLTKLHINENQLESFPSEISQFTQLTELDICNNHLQNLPSEIGKLTQLTELFICNNHLQNLPSEIGKLTKLKVLFLSYNQLQALPSCLARLQSSCTINAGCNGLSHEAIQTFQAQIAQQQSINPNCGPQFTFSIYDANKLTDNSTLDEIIAFWLQQFQGNFSCENIHYKALNSCLFKGMNDNDFYKPLQNLSPKDNNNLRTYLIRLKQTDDFKHPGACQMLILNTVCMLHGACTNKKFKKILFILLEDALSTCADRVANASNMICLLWLLYCGSQTLTKKQTAQLLVGAMRVDKLECFARQIIEKRHLGDAIETILYFKKELKEMIDLPIATEGMLYPAMSGVTPLDLQQAQAFVLEDTSSKEQIVAILMNSDVWKEKILQENAKKLEENAKKIEDIKEEFGRKLKKIMKRDLPWTEIDVLSKQLIKEREEAIKACVVEQVNVAEITKAFIADVSAFYPATQVLASLGITTKEQYSQTLGCTPKYLQSIGILTASDLAVLEVGTNPLSYLPAPKAEVEKKTDDFREVQQAALKKKECVINCLSDMAEKVKVKLKLNSENASLQKECEALLEKIGVAVENLQAKCKTPTELFKTFELESHKQIVDEINALVNAFNKLDCAFQVVRLNAYISQWEVLKAWKELKEKGIQCLEELKEQGTVENFFQMGV